MILWQHITNTGVLRGVLQLALDLTPRDRWTLLAVTAKCAINHDRVMTALGLLDGQMHMCDCHPCRKQTGAIVVVPDVAELERLANGCTPFPEECRRRMANGRSVFTFLAGTGCWE